ncbi:MAG: fatty acid desaturase [Solirubrobacteraceae bacterium]
MSNNNLITTPNTLLILEELKSWHAIIKKYQVPNNKLATLQVLQNFVLFASIWALQFFLFDVSNLWSITWVILLGILNGFFLGRIFIVQHDCGHKSFTSSNKWNVFIGTVCSLFTVIPFKYWAKSHNFHHEHNSQLETSGVGDVEVLTTEEYRKLPLFRKIRYRVYRSPLYLFTIGGFSYVTIYNRFSNLKNEYFNKVKNNVTYSNAAIGLVYVGIGYLLGPINFFVVQLINLFFFGTYALWFFYIQHQHKDIYKSPRENWNYLLSAIRGSTFYDLPRIGHWLSGNIGFHHIHHLSPTIPNYNLIKCSNENPILQKYALKMSLLESLKTVYANLWNESSNKMISFKEYRLLKRNKT